jgi:hypothetical protein
MSTTEEVLAHMAYAIGNAYVKTFPFPHIWVPQVFPRDYYEELRGTLPPTAEYKPGEKHYNGRVFGETDDIPLLDPFRTQMFASIAQLPFQKFLHKRFPTGSFPARTDLRLVADPEGYAIGPHTDAPWKVLSFLFYLPENWDHSDLGTSIYLPRDPNFRCKGGPHYPHEDFINIKTVPYAPNSLFAFFKTETSFHGVEPITIPCRRDVLLWNLYDATPAGS